MCMRHEVPEEVHSRILKTLITKSVAERPDSTWIKRSSATWSASMWIDMLEEGYARSKKGTVLGMIGWIGASEWYDAEIEQAKKAPPLTKRRRPRKRLATVVLDRYLQEEYSNTPMVASTTPSLDRSKDIPSSSTTAGIQQSIFDARRKKLIDVFHKGRILRKLIGITHLGILFDSCIWSYIKVGKENLDKVAAIFKECSKKMELLSILDEQVELLVEVGQPDLSLFLDSLESHSILPSGEVPSLRVEYGLERESLPQGILDTTIDSIVKDMGRVLDKHPLDQDQSVLVNGVVELSYSMFDRFRSRTWLSNWDIAAALDMADRPESMKVSQSIPLSPDDTISKPLYRWRKKIDEHGSSGTNNLHGLQVYLCPLNLGSSHFTLLEINEQTKIISHYDSMASPNIIHGKTKSTLMRQAVEEELKYLSFGYLEAPTPQQEDGWSCGLMVIRNAKQRMKGLSVGSWDDKVDPERVIMEVLKDCQTNLEKDALQASSLLKKRKKVVHTLERSPKRRKDMSKDVHKEP